MTKREKMKRLQEIYDALPKVQCKGLCSDCCGPIPVEGIERERMMKRDPRTKELPKKTGVPAALRGEMCVHLTNAGRCRIYSDRPLICRAWGVSEALPCHHGCQPDRQMSNEEVYLLHAEIERLSGRFPDADEVIVARVRELESTGYFAALRPTHPMEKAHKSNTVKEFRPNG
jgi:Fe-S-cluster containining protein